jgi:hypothetical protein
MSSQNPTGGGEGRPPSEEELRAAYEAELKRLRVEDVVLQTVVSLLNLGGRKAGLVPGTEDERDLSQVQMAIEGVRALLPLIEPQLGPDATQLREALSQLQLAYAQLGGAAAGAGPSGGEGGEGGEGGGGAQQPPPQQPGDSGPAQRSGRLWVPGQ